MKKSLCTWLSAIIISSPVIAHEGDEPHSHTSTESSLNVGVILDAYYQYGGARAFSEYDSGFGLGHTEIGFNGNIDDLFSGTLTTVIDSHGDEANIAIEEAFITTGALGYGINLKAGRFLSDFGYLNNKHKHTDYFSERPLQYRNFLGDHYFDDGASFTYVLPTSLYMQLSFEAFNGNKLNHNLEYPDEYHYEDLNKDYDVGVYTANFKLGGDINASSSYQLGFSYLRNQRANVKVDYTAHSHVTPHSIRADDHDHGHDDHGHGHAHSHGASASAQNLYNVDLTYKWFKNGNLKNNGLILGAEYLLAQGLVANGNDDIDNYTDTLNSFYVKAIYQFNQSFNLATRYGYAQSYDFHLDGHGDHIDPHFETEKYQEIDLALNYYASHFSNIRLGYTYLDYDNEDKDHIFTLQYIMSLGAHGAHSF